MSIKGRLIADNYKSNWKNLDTFTFFDLIRAAIEKDEIWEKDRWEPRENIKLQVQKLTSKWLSKQLD